MQANLSLSASSESGSSVSTDRISSVRAGPTNSFRNRAASEISDRSVRKLTVNYGNYFDFESKETFVSSGHVSVKS